MLLSNFLRGRIGVTILLSHQGHLRTLELSLLLHAHVRAELCLLDNILEQGWLLVIFIRAAKDLANLCKCEALHCTSLQKK